MVPWENSACLMDRSKLNIIVIHSYSTGFVHLTDICLNSSKRRVTRFEPPGVRIKERLSLKCCAKMLTTCESRILTEDAQPVVDSYDNYIPIAGQDTAVKHIPSSFHIRAPMDEHHHRLGASTLPNIWRRVEEEEEKMVEKADRLIRRQNKGGSQKCNFNI